MVTFEQIISQLRFLFEMESELQKKLDNLLKSGHEEAFKDEISVRIDEEMKKNLLNIKKQLERLLRYPPHFAHHLEKLKKFHLSGDYERSVFIMTKFPNLDSSDDKDQTLTKIIETIKEAVLESNYIPRIASDYDYQDIIWSNVEFHLLGCSKGIAIIEDCYKNEFNPNVAMEWGWMRAMGKPVLYLVEENFNNERADAAGFIGYRFSWNNPEEKIKILVKNWLRDR